MYNFDSYFVYTVLHYMETMAETVEVAANSQILRNILRDKGDEEFEKKKFRTIIMKISFINSKHKKCLVLVNEFILCAHAVFFLLCSFCHTNSIPIYNFTFFSHVSNSFVFIRFGVDVHIYIVKTIGKVFSANSDLQQNGTQTNLRDLYVIAFAFVRLFWRDIPQWQLTFAQFSLNFSLSLYLFCFYIWWFCWYQFIGIPCELAERWRWEKRWRWMLIQRAKIHKKIVDII